MALREIIILPDKQLRLVSKPVEKVTAEIRKLADDMFETMYDAPGIGLAAIQVAQPLRLITMDLAKRDEDGESKPRPRVFINPEILSVSEEMSVYEEGCLSIPEYYEEVERPAKVRVRFTDLDGRAARGRRRGPVRHLHPARDRSPQRRAVRGLPVEAEARPRAEEICQGRQARGGVGFGRAQSNCRHPEVRRRLKAPSLEGRRRTRLPIFPAPSFEARKGSHLRMTLVILKLGSKGSLYRHVPPLDLHGHAGFRGADAAGTRRPWP